MTKEKKISWFARMFGSAEQEKPEDRRRLERKRLTYYIRISNADTREILGQILEINTMGLSVDLLIPLPLEIEYTLRMDLLDSSFEKLYITFKAYSKWRRADPINAGFYNMGFEITQIDPEDIEVIERVASLYGERS